MQLEEALEQLQQAAEQSKGRHLNICIPVFRPGSIGGTPCVMVQGVRLGFDWDHGKVMLITEEQLTTLSPEDVAAIRDSARKGQSWHAYQTYKAMQEKLDAAEARAEGLRAQLDVLQAQLDARHAP